MHGGTVSGTPTLDAPYMGYGGNILAIGSQTDIENCTITDGTAEFDGGNIAIYKRSATAAMSAAINATVTGGKAGNDGGNLYVFGAMNNQGKHTPIELSLTGTFTGGSNTGVRGGIGSGQGKDIYVTRSAVTLDGKVTVDELYLGAGQTLNVDTMDASSTVGKVVMDRDGTIALTDDGDKAACFADAVHTDGKITKATFTAPTVESFSAGMTRVRITPKWNVPLDGMGYEKQYLEGDYKDLVSASDIYMDVYVLADGKDLEALKKNSTTEYWNLPLNAISFGDVAIATFPHELFSSTALTVKEGSPFAMTFTLSLTNGGYRYMADQAAWDHSSNHYTEARFGGAGLNREDSFEIRSTKCVEGTAERIAQWHVNTLEELAALSDEEV